MKYYKNVKGELFVDPIVENHAGLVEITQDEFNELIQPSAEVLMARLENQAKATRQEVINSNITVFDVEWQVATTDRENIKEAIDYAQMHDVPSDTTINWILADNSTMDVTYAQLVAVLSAYMLRKQDVFNEYKTWRAGDKTEPFVYEYQPEVVLS